MTSSHPGAGARVLLVLNEAPCGSGRADDGLRLAGALSRRAVGVCGTCIEARGISESGTIDGSRRSTLDELTSWTLESDKVIVF